MIACAQVDVDYALVNLIASFSSRAWTGSERGYQFGQCSEQAAAACQSSPACNDPFQLISMTKADITVIKDVR